MYICFLQIEVVSAYDPENVGKTALSYLLKKIYKNNIQTGDDEVTMDVLYVESFAKTEIYTIITSESLIYFVRCILQMGNHSDVGTFMLYNIFFDCMHVFRYCQEVACPFYPPSKAKSH